jgi:phosphomannomutase
LSGHIFFSDSWYGFDDGLYCAVRMLNVLNAADVPLSALLSDMPVMCSTPEVRVEVDEEDKFQMVERLAMKAREEAQSEEGVKIIDIDGVRVEYPYGWWLLRASNTQNCLTIRMEADTEKNLTKIYDSVQALIRPEGLDLTVTMH